MRHLSIAQRVTVESQEKHTDARLEALYKQYVNRIHRYISARIGSHQEAEDLTAQTFLKALVGLRRGWNGENATGWLFGIARHVVADHYRNRREVVSLTAASHVAASEPALSDMVDQNLRLERVAAALGTLSPDRAEALALRIFGGLSTGEVATVMNKSQEAAKMLVYRAVQDLQKRLGYTGEI